MDIFECYEKLAEAQEALIGESKNFGAEEIKFEYTALDRQLMELQQLREDFDKYRADQAAYHAAEEHRTKVAERKGFLLGSLSAFIASILAGLFIYYWPHIVGFLANCFQ